MRRAIQALPQVGQGPAGPPVWLPLAFVAQAAGWLWLGALGLTTIAPDLAMGLTVMPRTFAVVHLFSLGVLGAATLGALHQFIPVVTGVGLRHPRAAIASARRGRISASVAPPTATVITPPGSRPTICTVEMPGKAPSARSSSRSGAITLSTVSPRPVVFLASPYAVSSATRRPWSRISTRRHVMLTSGRMWVDSSTVVRPASDRISERISTIWRGSRAFDLVGHQIDLGYTVDLGG